MAASTTATVPALTVRKEEKCEEEKKERDLIPTEVRERLQQIDTSEPIEKIRKAVTKILPGAAVVDRQVMAEFLVRWGMNHVMDNVVLLRDNWHVVVDLQNDPYNCGMVGHPSYSGRCVNGYAFG